MGSTFITQTAQVRRLDHLGTAIAFGMNLVEMVPLQSFSRILEDCRACFALPAEVNLCVIGQTFLHPKPQSSFLELSAHHASKLYRRHSNHF